MHNIRLFCGTQCSALPRGSKPELKFRTTDEADTVHEVSGLPTARKPWYIFSLDFVQIATFLACNASARHRLFWINAECICRRRFHYSLSFALFLSKNVSKAKIMWHLSMLAIDFGYEYFCSVIYFSNIFFVKTFFQNFFLKFFS